MSHRAQKKRHYREKLSVFFRPDFLLSLILSFALSLFFISSVRAQNLEKFIGKNVAEVKISYEGTTTNLSTDDLRGLVRLREGSPYSAVEVRRSLLALFDSGRVSNARVEAQLNNSDTVIVSFLVTPQLRTGNLDFNGLVPEITKEELRAKLPDLERGLKYAETNVTRGADLIAETFKDRGYYQASVETKTVPDSTGTVINITYNVTSGSPAKIAALNLTGDSKISETLLRPAIKSKIGSTFVRSTLSADIQQLLQLHLEKNYLAARIGPPDINYDSAKNGVVINLPVNSGPILVVKITGAQITDKKLRQILPFMREGGIDEASLDDGGRRIRDHLQEEGYFFAEVTPPPMPDLSGESAGLEYKVEPGERYRVTDIRIEGTKNISLTEIGPGLQTQTAAFFPIPLLTTRYIRGITSEQAIRRDTDFILSQLRDQGYRKARMAAVNRAVSENNDQLKIIFKVAEGPRSYIGDVAFKGNTLFTTEELRRKVDLTAGDPVSVSRIKIEANKVLQQYYDRGYATATVIARTTEMGGERVRVVYDVTEGSRIFINRIFINQIGARHRTIEGRVKNYFRFKEGGLLKNEELFKSEQDLYAAGAFRHVQIRTEPLGEETETGEAQRNVFIDLEENKSRSLVYGGGYQSDDGPRGIFEISDPNIFGRINTASFRFRASPRDILGQISYTDPRPFNYRTPLLFSLLAQQQKRPAFDSTRLTGLLQVEKQLGERSLLLFRYNYEAISVRPPSTGGTALSLSQALAQLDRRDQPVRLSRLSTSYAFDGRDNPFDATIGRYHTADITVALRSLGGNGQFVRLFTENQYYRRLSGKHAPLLATNARVGLSANIGNPIEKILPAPNLRTPLDSKLIPLTERFFSGGSTTLRGYNFELAGPRQCIVTEVTNPVSTATTPDPRIGKDCSLVNNTEIKSTTDQIIGGNALVILNAELRQPIYRQISMVGFYDGGNVFRTIQDIKPSNFSHSFGVGVRVKTPLGPLRFDIGYLASDPFRGTGLRRPTDPNNPNVPYTSNPTYSAPRIRFHISFGQAF